MVKKAVRDAIIAAAKEKHKGGLFLAEYSFADRQGKTVDLCFAYREPTGAELQAYSEMLERDGIAANRWLMMQIVVSTEGDVPILEIVGVHNIAVSTFVAKYVNPLFGKVLDTQPIQSL